jgi:DNA-binding NarL/FixJ family response regulator
MSHKTAIVIVDDHPLFRKGLRQIIEAEAHLEIVGEAGDGQRALKLIRACKPNIAIIDISMPEFDGFDLARAVRKENLPVALIFLTMYCADEGILKKALDLEVKGYVAKDSAVTDIVSCINAVNCGQHFTSPALTTYLINSSRQTVAGSAKCSDQGRKELSQSELRVVELIAEYKTSADIADALFISRRTVESHRTHICQKLGLHGSHALMKFALERKASVRSANPPTQNYVIS